MPHTNKQQQQILQHTSHNTTTTTVIVGNNNHLHHHPHQQQHVQQVHLVNSSATQQHQFYNHTQQQVQSGHQQPTQQQQAHMIQVPEEYLEQSQVQNKSHSATTGAANMMISATGEVIQQQQIFKIVSTDAATGNVIIDASSNNQNVNTSTTSKVLLSNLTVLSKQQAAAAGVAGQQQSPVGTAQTINFVNAKHMYTASSAGNAAAGPALCKQHKFSVTAANLGGSFKTTALKQTTNTQQYMQQTVGQQKINLSTANRNSQILTTSGRIQASTGSVGGAISSTTNTAQTMVLQQPHKFLGTNTTKTTLGPGGNVIKKTTGTLRMSNINNNANKFMNNFHTAQGVKTFITQTTSGAQMQHQQQQQTQNISHVPHMGSMQQHHVKGGSKSKFVKQYTNAIINSSGSVAIATLPHQQHQHPQQHNQNISLNSSHQTQHQHLQTNQSGFGNHHHKTAGGGLTGVTGTPKVNKLNSKYAAVNVAAQLPPGTQLHQKSTALAQTSAQTQQYQNTLSSSNNNNSNIKFVNAQGTIIQQQQSQQSMTTTQKIHIKQQHNSNPQYQSMQHIDNVEVVCNNNNTYQQQISNANSSNSSTTAATNSILSDEIMMVNGTQMTDELSARILQSMSQKSFNNQRYHQQNLVPKSSSNSNMLPPQTMTTTNSSISNAVNNSHQSNILLSPRECILFPPSATVIGSTQQQSSPTPHATMHSCQNSQISAGSFNSVSSPSGSIAQSITNYMNVSNNNTTTIAPHSELLGSGSGVNNGTTLPSSSRQAAQSLPNSRSQSMERKLHEYSLSRKSTDFYKNKISIHYKHNCAFVAPSTTRIYVTNSACLKPSALIDIVLPFPTCSSITTNTIIASGNICTPVTTTVTSPPPTTNNTSSNHNVNMSNIADITTTQYHNIISNISGSNIRGSHDNLAASTQSVHTGTGNIATSSALTSSVTPSTLMGIQSISSRPTSSLTSLEPQTALVHLPASKTDGSSKCVNDNDDIVGEETRPLPVETSDIHLQILHAVLLDHTYANPMPSELPTAFSVQIPPLSQAREPSTLMEACSGQQPHHWSLGGIGAVAATATSAANNTTHNAAVTTSNYSMYSSQSRLQQDEDKYSALGCSTRLPVGDIDPGEETETAPEAEAEDDSVTRCICDLTHDDGYMICCDKCCAWQHVDCMGIDRQNIPDEYLCELCQPRPVDKTRARALQVQKRKEQNQLLLAQAQAAAAAGTIGAAGSASGNGAAGASGVSSLLQNETLVVQQCLALGVGDFGDSGDTSSMPSLNTAGGANIKKGSKILKKMKEATSGKKTKKADKIAAAGSSLAGKTGRKETKKNGKRKKGAQDGNSTAGMTAAEKHAANLRLWIENYELAVTNHYSPELRARLHAITKQTSLLQSILNTENPVLKDLSLGNLENRATTVPHAGGKILISNFDIGPNSPICELRGKYMLTTQYKTQNTSMNMNTPPPNNYHMASYKAHKTPGPFIFFYQLQGGDVAATTVATHQGPNQTTTTTTLNPDGTFTTTTTTLPAQLSPPPTHLKGPEICVDTRTYGNEARFVRRSCRPNAEIQHLFEKGTIHLFLVSLTDIRASTEITIRHEPHDIAAVENRKSNTLVVQPTSTQCACGLIKDCVFGPPVPPPMPLAAKTNAGRKSIALNGSSSNPGNLTAKQRKVNQQNLNRNRSTSSSGDSNMGGVAPASTSLTTATATATVGIGLNSPNNLNMDAKSNKSSGINLCNPNVVVPLTASCNSNGSTSSCALTNIVPDSGICTSSSSPSVSIPSPTQNMHSPIQQQQYQPQHLRPAQISPQQQYQLMQSLPAPLIIANDKQQQQQHVLMQSPQAATLHTQSPQHQQSPQQQPIGIITSIAVVTTSSPNIGNETQKEQQHQQQQLQQEQHQEQQQQHQEQQQQHQEQQQQHQEQQQQQQHHHQQQQHHQQQHQQQQHQQEQHQQEQHQQEQQQHQQQQHEQQQHQQHQHQQQQHQPHQPHQSHQSHQQQQQHQQQSSPNLLQVPPAVQISSVVESPNEGPPITATTLQPLHVAQELKINPNSLISNEATQQPQEVVLQSADLSNEPTIRATVENSTPLETLESSTISSSSHGSTSSITSPQQQQKSAQKVNQTTAVQIQQSQSGRKTPSKNSRTTSFSEDNENHANDENLVASAPNSTSTPKEKPKLSREDRKMEAILRAIEKMERSQQRKNDQKHTKKQNSSSQNTTPTSPNKTFDSADSSVGATTKRSNSHTARTKKRRKAGCKGAAANNNQRKHRQICISSQESVDGCGRHEHDTVTSESDGCNAMHSPPVQTVAALSQSAEASNDITCIGDSISSTVDQAAGLLLAFANPHVELQIVEPNLQSPHRVSHYLMTSSSPNEATASPPPTPPSHLSSACLLIEAAVGPLESNLDSNSGDPNNSEFKYPLQAKTKKLLMNNWLHQEDETTVTASGTSLELTAEAAPHIHSCSVTGGLDSLVQATMSDFKQTESEEAVEAQPHNHNLSIMAQRVEEFIHLTECGSPAPPPTKHSYEYEQQQQPLYAMSASAAVDLSVRNHAAPVINSTPAEGSIFYSPQQVSTCSNNSSVKKRWLRQAISEESHEESQTVYSTSPSHASTPVMTSQNCVNLPQIQFVPSQTAQSSSSAASVTSGHIPNGFTTPLKKRRLLLADKEEIMDDNMGQCTTDSYTQASSPSSPGKRFGVQELAVKEEENEEKSLDGHQTTAHEMQHVDLEKFKMQDATSANEEQMIVHSNAEFKHYINVTDPRQKEKKAEVENENKTEVVIKSAGTEEDRQEILQPLNNIPTEFNDQEDDVDILRSPSPGQEMIKAEDNLVKIEPEDTSGNDDVKIDVEREESIAADDVMVIQLKQEYKEEVIEGMKITTVASIKHEKGEADVSAQGEKVNEQQVCSTTTKTEWTVVAKQEEPQFKAEQEKTSVETEEPHAKRFKAEDNLEIDQHQIENKGEKVDNVKMEKVDVKKVAEKVFKTEECITLTSELLVATTTTPSSTKHFYTTANTVSSYTGIESETPPLPEAAKTILASSLTAQPILHRAKPLSDDDIQARLHNFHKENILFLQSRNKKSKSSNSSASSANTNCVSATYSSVAEQRHNKNNTSPAGHHKHHLEGKGKSENRKHKNNLSTSKKSKLNKRERTSSSSSCTNKNSSLTSGHASAKNATVLNSSNSIAPPMASSSNSSTSKKKSLKKSSSGSSTSSINSSSSSNLQGPFKTSTVDKKKMQRQRTTSGSSNIAANSTATSFSTPHAVFSASKKRQLNFELELTKDMHLRDSVTSNTVRHKRLAEDSQSHSSSKKSKKEVRGVAAIKDDSKNGPSKLQRQLSACEDKPKKSSASNSLSSKAYLNSGTLASVTTTVDCAEDANNLPPVSTNTTVPPATIVKEHPTIPHFNNVILDTTTSATVQVPLISHAQPFTSILNNANPQSPTPSGQHIPNHLNNTSYSLVPADALNQSQLHSTPETPSQILHSTSTTHLPFYNTIYGKLLDSHTPSMTCATVTSNILSTTVSPSSLATSSSVASSSTLSEYLDTKLKSYNTLGGYVSHTALFGLNNSHGKESTSLIPKDDASEMPAPYLPPVTTASAVLSLALSSSNASASSPNLSTLKIHTKTANHDPRLNPQLTAPEPPPQPKRKLSILEYRKRMQKSTSHESTGSSLTSTPTTPPVHMEAVNAVAGVGSVFNKCTLNSPERLEQSVDSQIQKEIMSSSSLNAFDSLNCSSSSTSNSSQNESLLKSSSFVEEDSTKGQFNAAPTLLEKQQESLCARLKSLKEKQGLASALGAVGGASSRSRFSSFSESMGSGEFGLRKDDDDFELLNRKRNHSISSSNAGVSLLDNCLEEISSTSTSMSSSREPSPERYHSSHHQHQHDKHLVTASATTTVATASSSNCGSASHTRGQQYHLAHNDKKMLMTSTTDLERKKSMDIA